MILIISKLNIISINFWSRWFCIYLFITSPPLIRWLLPLSRDDHNEWLCLCWLGYVHTNEDTYISISRDSNDGSKVRCPKTNNFLIKRIRGCNIVECRRRNNKRILQTTMLRIMFPHVMASFSQFRLNALNQ